MCNRKSETVNYTIQSKKTIFKKVDHQDISSRQTAAGRMLDERILTDTLTPAATTSMLLFVTWFILIQLKVQWTISWWSAGQSHGDDVRHSCPSLFLSVFSVSNLRVTLHQTRNGALWEMCVVFWSSTALITVTPGICPAKHTQTL